jgi:hypothetical protein
MLPRSARAIAGALAAALLAAQPLYAESALRMELPERFGVIPAATYDTRRERIGSAHLVIERLDDAKVRIFSESGIQDGAHTVATAELAPEAGGRWLRLVLQESRTFNRDGTPRGLLRIDHRQRLGSCTPPGGASPPRTLELPDPDRIANVPLNLFFLPLVRGNVERIDFQLFLCSGGPRLVDFQATRAPSNGRDAPSQIVEIRYGPELGPVLSLIAPSLLPKLSFWFDRAKPNRWLAHRIPLYSDGPEVLVIRDGIPPRWLSDE